MLNNYNDHYNNPFAVLISGVLISICLVVLIVARKHNSQDHINFYLIMMFNCFSYCRISLFLTGKRTVYVESNQAYDIVELRQRGQTTTIGHIAHHPPPPLPQGIVHIKTEPNTCYETVLLSQIKK